MAKRGKRIKLSKRMSKRIKLSKRMSKRIKLSKRMRKRSNRKSQKRLTSMRKFNKSNRRKNNTFMGGGGEEFENPLAVDTEAARLAEAEAQAEAEAERMLWNNYVIECTDHRIVRDEGKVPQYVEYCLKVKVSQTAPGSVPTLVEEYEIWRRWTECMDLGDSCYKEFSGNRFGKNYYKLKFPKAYHQRLLRFNSEQLEVRRQKLDKYFKEFAKWVNTIITATGGGVDLMTNPAGTLRSGSRSGKKADPKNIVSGFFSELKM